MNWLNATLLCIFLAACLSVAPLAAANGIKDTKHNLTVADPNDPMSRICIFCHTPHSASSSSPLWNRNLPTLVYSPYTSTTLQSAPDQPTHSSKLCLSCHDGTIAMGRILQGGGSVARGGKITGSANLTTDLSDDHPISFVYNSALAASDRELVDPALLVETSVHLDEHNQLQCTTCHDPHSTPYPNFLVTDNKFSALCTTCHELSGWNLGSHATSSAEWNGVGTNPWPHSDWTTVAENGCESCHAAHSARQPQRLLNFQEEESNCLSCHSGNVAESNIAQALMKPYRHDVSAYLELHDPTEMSQNMPRHVECQDCHNPHASSDTESVAPYVSGALTGVAGITLTGIQTDDADFQYEVCFRCHADNTNVPPPYITRQIQQHNLRLKFQVGNPSAHPISAPGSNNDVPSLLTHWKDNSQIFCTDCHASDTGPGAGGTGAKGPHGSVWPFLLEREYRIADNTQESYQAYALCYKCHDQDSILADESFKYHKKHIEEEQTPCSACHDPHGISLTQGNPVNNSHLINFDTSIVQPDPETGLLAFEDLGRYRGQCYMECHGKSHSPKEY